MAKFFELHGGKDYQLLSISGDLRGIEREPGFPDLLEGFGLRATRLKRPLYSVFPELVVRPPLPPERIQAFGDALVSFANQTGLSRAYAYHDEVSFNDNTADYERRLAYVHQLLRDDYHVSEEDIRLKWSWDKISEPDYPGQFEVEIGHEEEDD